jgi:peptidyl-prolyl cis-trans isomerase A (cyclophilin A)
MKSTWIAASLVSMMTAFASAQPAPAPAFSPPPAPTPPIVGVNNEPNTGVPPPSSQPMPPGLFPPMPVRTAPMNGNIRSNVSGAYGFNSPAAPEKPLQSEIIKVLPPAQRPPEVRAVLRTSVGDITVRLDRVNAPLTVDYFTGIAKGEMDFTDIKTSKPVKRPFYNGLIFHRVVKNTLIQTGDPFGNGRGGSGRTIPDEIKPSMKFDRPGLVAMAPMRESKGTDIAKGTNSSQFFITLREMPEWNGQYTIFGEVEDGLDVVQKIANSKVGPTERPIKRIYLVAVDILESAK